MKCFCFLIIFFFTHISLGQDITIVAVGDAEEDKISVSISSEFPEDVISENKSRVDEVLNIVKADFQLYKHKFEVVSQAKQYKVLLKHFMDGVEPFVQLVVSDVINKSTILEHKEKIWKNNTRSFAHQLADKAYFAITGKSSVFNTKIVFVSDRNLRKKKLIKELYIMDFDGERKQRLTFRNSIVIAPAISPDNKKILFSAIESRWVKSKSPRQSVQKVQNLNLYVYDLSTRKIDLISSKSGINSGAVFNKEGTSIYLTLSYLKNADIFKMDLKTKSLEKMTSHYSPDVDPHINADESVLTFLSSRHGRANIYTKELNTKEKKVTRVSYVGQFNAAPRFNPEGDEIVFSSWVDNRFDLYRIGSDGRNLVRLTKDFGSNEEPWFSPDGEFIVFTSQRVISRKKAVQNIHIMTRDGELVKQLTTEYGKVYTPRWSN